MFTGIITGTSSVLRQKPSKQGLTLSFKKPRTWETLTLGESIATDGVCLTVSATRGDEYDCFLMPETLSKSSFGHKIPGEVNLERALSLSDRLGGHFVQGHVDATGTVKTIQTGKDYQLTINFPTQFASLVIYKGSITINGVSLTVVNTQNNTLTVALIPHTLEHTTLGSLEVGDQVNLEFDMIGKYVAKIMESR